jgi:hypothetical protein
MPDTFTLEVTVSGLCVLLPRPSKMHVLMVCDCEHDGNMEPHYPRVYYDAAYDSPGPSVLPIGTAYSAIALEKRILDLATAQAPGGTVSGLPDYLLDLSNFTPPLPDPETDEVPNLCARVTLPPGIGVCPNPQGAWELRWGKYSSTLDLVGWHVVWTTTGMKGSSLTWRLDGLNGFPGMPLTPLYPKQGYVRLLVSNVILKESLPGPLHQGIPPAEGTPMPHFHAFSCLFPNPPSPWPEMVFMGPRQPVNSTAYSCVPSGGH